MEFSPFPFVELGIGIAVLIYLYAGWSLITPLGWYFGTQKERHWWLDAIYVISALVAIILWLPILVIAIASIADKV